MQETWVQSLDQEDPLEKGMTAHSSILVWRIPWTEEPGGLQSMGSPLNWHTPYIIPIISIMAHLSIHEQGIQVLYEFIGCQLQLMDMKG